MASAQSVDELARKAGWPYKLSAPPVSRSEVVFPDVRGFRAVKSDFHIHTIYSDGQVTPETRVIEAWRDGFDALAITDHSEYHRIALPEKKGRSYGDALGLAKQFGLTLIRSAEVSTVGAIPRPARNTDFVVAFLTDELALHVEFSSAMKAARQQGAINIWAHPGPKWDPRARRFLEEGWLHGIELRNTVVSENRGNGQKEVRGFWFWPQVMDWANEHKLAVIASSDAHWPIDLMTRQRDMTLVLAQSASPAHIREAISVRRTIACFGEMLWGPAEWVEAATKEWLVFEATPESTTGVRPRRALKVRNRSSLPFALRLKAEGAKFPPGDLVVPAMATKMIHYTAPEEIKAVEVEAANVFSASNRNVGFRVDLR